MIRVYIGVAVLLAIVTTGYFGYRYVSSLQDKLETYKVRSEVLELTVASQERAISTIRSNVDTQRRMYDALQLRLTAARLEVSKMTRVFNDHDFEKLLNAKPGLIHKRMRIGTNRVFRSIEKASRDN